MPPEPTSSGQRGEKVKPPTPVTVSFILYVLAGLVLVLAFGYTLTQQDLVAETLIDLNTAENLSEEQIRWVSRHCCGRCSSVPWPWRCCSRCSRKARQGTRSARTVLTVLTAIIVLLQLLLFPTSLPMLVASLLAVAGTVLLYLPSVALLPQTAGLGGTRR